MLIMAIYFYYKYNDKLTYSLYVLFINLDPLFVSNYIYMCSSAADISMNECANAKKVDESRTLYVTFLRRGLEQVSSGHQYLTTVAVLILLISREK